MKKILEIHEIKKEYFGLPLEDYVLTFNEGLLNQYGHLKELRKIKTEKIFFIATGAITKDPQNRNKRKHMSLDQILEIKHMSHFEIGAMGHGLLDYRKNKDNIVNILMRLKKDSEEMKNFFSKELRIKPTKFCFPFNNEIFGYRRMLRDQGYTDFYGADRIDIDSLL